MRVIWLVLVVLVAGSANAEQVKDGFKGFKWGTPRAEMDSVFELKQSDEGQVGVWKLLNEGESTAVIKTYLASVETIGGIEITECTLFFYKDQFFYLRAYFTSESNCKKLIKAAISAYGDPIERSSDGFEVNWTDVNSYRSLNFSPQLQTGDFISGSLNLYLETKRAYEAKRNRLKTDKIDKEKAEAEEGAKDF